MQRKNFYLSDVEIRLLEQEAKRLDIASSDLLRRIIDKHFEQRSETGYVNPSIDVFQNIYAVSGGSIKISGTRTL